MKIKDIFEKVDTIMRTPQTRHVDLYFGCCVGLAQTLETSGFKPSIFNMKKMPLFSTIEAAKEFAEEKDCSSILKVKKIPANYLQVDLQGDNIPRDIWDAIDKVNSGEDIKLFLVNELPSTHFEFLNKLRRAKY